ncbi:MAG TPA: hypothetical protein VK589_00260 [Chryseolinea sp.]|nr:hypothetical protein [Chryseolinea sp.]
MKKSTKKFIGSLAWIALFVVILGACQNDDVNPLTTKENASLSARDNSQIVAATEEVMDITDGIFVSRGFSGGRTADGGPGHDGHDDEDDDDQGDDHGDKHHDSRGCKPSISGSFNLDRSHQDSLIYTGTFIVDYGDGLTCPDSAHVRKGKVMDSITFIVSFKDSITFTSTETVTFEGFTKDSTSIDGKFIIKSSTGNPTTVEAQGAQITYADGTSFSWDGTLTFAYEKKGSRHCKGNIMKITDGSIEGTTRSGAEFTATITKEIVFKRGCNGKRFFVPVSGTVDITTGGVTSTLDYGDGSCDKDFTITTAGETIDHSFS